MNETESRNDCWSANQNNNSLSVIWRVGKCYDCWRIDCWSEREI